MVRSPLRPPATAATYDADAFDPHSRDYRQLTKLLQLVRPYRWRFWVATLALFISSGLGLVYPQAARKAIDFGVSTRSMADLNQMIAMLVGVFFIQAAFIWIRHYQMSWLGQRVVSDLRVQVFARLVRLPPSWFHRRHTGEILSRLASDVTVIDGLVGTELSMALRHGVTLLGGIVLLLVENWKLTVLMLGVVPPVMVAIVFFGRRVRRLAKQVQDRLAETSTQVEEVVSAIQTVQSFVREGHEQRTYQRHIGAVFDEQLRLIGWRSTFMSGLTLSVSLAIALVMWVGGRAVIHGELSGGDLTAFLLYTAMVAASVGAMASLTGALSRAAGATERLFDILATEPAIQDPPDPQPLPGGGGAVRFDAVHFSYPTRAEVEVIRGVTLDLAAGESLALVGGSGAGKSTLAALLQRFHDVQGGSIRIDGVDIRRLRLAELRGAIAIVAQEPVLFSGSIRDNIAYGRPDASQTEIEAVARDAYAHDFITAFPDGYDTRVGERGVQLSGGQRQRVAIARALLANPRVLILDEATSALDAQSEALVQQALKRLMQGRTTLIIAHRLSTVRDAACIAVLEHGAVVEMGRHDALMARDGAYRKLVEHQVFADVRAEGA
jgi:ABC transporter fused permease/ATP-binding protein